MRLDGTWLGGFLLLTGCGGGQEEAPVVNGMVVANETEPPASPAAPSPNVTTDGWIGRWTGVEGLALQVGAGERPGTYQLVVTLMDGTREFTGTAMGETIRFTRDGVTESIRHTNGAETGLKWLAAKRDCLTIKPGEGFCRD